MYAVDLVFRVGQASQVSAITAAKVSEDGSVLTWQLAADEVCPFPSPPLSSLTYLLRACSLTR